ncbi:CHP3 [Glarea lozoyensis ATCC 20868]|uniref:CHP3 n=1 Tax=Glarea lozoyensis (strain ATCC 20868 / MF5171) TaxID=1116229 RepID=S3CYV3_GLAL2|nr:CHP3 [Glarea lozoyensis ATCC 20868]EPE30124.1 CHP3 [Glarea lozoyensis ATCC 20868]
MTVINGIDLTEDRRDLLLISTWLWTAIAAVFVAGRYYCRIKLMRAVWWDDWMILVSVCCSVAVSVIWTMYANAGGCRHQQSLTKPEQVIVFRLNFLSHPWCIIGLLTGKLSVAFLILRFQSPTRWRTRLIIGLCAPLVLMVMVNVTVIFTQCRPVQFLWDKDKGGKCIDPIISPTIGKVVGSYMAFLDLALAAIPVQMIWNLQMVKSKKIAICCLLSTGVSAFGFAVVKVTSLGHIANRTDLTWATVLLFVWNVYEMNVVIIAACIPTLVPLFHIMIGRKTKSDFAQNQSGGSAGYNGYHPEYSVRMRDRIERNSKSQRLESIKSMDGESIQALGQKTKITVEPPSPVVSPVDTWYDDDESDRKISVTKQWSVQR